MKTFVHGVPHGGWFELVSCPHYFAELLIYISLGLVFGGLSLTWWTVVSYVLFNQALAAQLCQEFYMTKFEGYPRHRYAFIPFVLWHIKLLVLLFFVFLLLFKLFFINTIKTEVTCSMYQYQTFINISNKHCTLIKLFICKTHVQLTAINNYVKNLPP